MYDFYLGNMLLPIAPSKLSFKINNQNKTYTQINEGVINVLKKAGLTEIEFDATIPNVQYPFAKYKNGFQNAKIFLDSIEKLKINQKPFQFIITRTFPDKKTIFNTNMKVSLESYTIKEEAKNGFDIVVSFKLKQYKDYGAKICNIQFNQSSSNTVTTEVQRETNNSPKPQQNQNYTVEKGDCLWNIAKKFYGNGSQYTIIYDANKDKIQSPNKIYPGQILTIPAA